MREKQRRRRFSLRALLRSLHRDAGYLVVGLTFVYALSGLAVNHIADWDPNFNQIERTHAWTSKLPTNDTAAAQLVLDELGVAGKPTEVYRLDTDRIDVVLDQRTLHVDAAKGEVFEEGQEPRFFLRVANWLHLNRGKKAWTYFADGYAVLLLFLATSGLFMIPGRKGLLGRGGFLVFAGSALPILYVVWSKGP